MNSVGIIVVILFGTHHCYAKQCPTGWTNTESLCYLFMKDATNFVTWSLAQQGCMKLDLRGHLPIFRDEKKWKTFQTIINMFNKKLAAQGTPAPGKEPARYLPFGAYKTDGQWQWLDGVQVDIDLLTWQEGQPNGTDESQENCLGYDLDKSFGISDIPCGKDYAYLCQLDYDEEAPEGLSEDWTLVDSIYYYITSASELVTKEEGKQKCTDLDARAKLPEFHNSHDYEQFIRYIGTVAEADHKPVIMGIEKYMSNFVNTDNTKVDFTIWAPNQPYEIETGEDCVSSNDFNGFTWEGYDCANPGLIVCQLDIRRVVGPLQQSTLSTTQATLKSGHNDLNDTKNNHGNTNTTGNSGNSGEATVYHGCIFIVGSFLIALQFINC